jgi:hypothetical protein
LEQKLGNTIEKNEPGELIYNAYQIGSKEDDVLLESGAIVQTPESNGDNDEVGLLIPSEVVKATITVG